MVVITNDDLDFCFRKAGNTLMLDSEIRTIYKK